MKSDNFSIRKLIEQLQGTSESIESLLPEGMEWEDLSTQDHEILDSEIFKCTTCDWWCEISDQSDDGEQCRDCNPQDED